MIIGINGKIGSGKDTVGKIIQYLQCYKTAKITIEEIVNNSDHEWLLEEQSKWEIKKFAGKLKTVASILTGIPVEMFEDQDFKLTNLPEEWSSLKQSGRNKVLIPMTVREFLQKLGTEAMRDGLHSNVWVNALFADYNPIAKFAGADIVPNWIITDMRFPNEMEAVVAKGGITIRVVRNNDPKYSDEQVKSILKNMGYVDLSDGVWEELAINEGFTWFEKIKLWTWDETDLALEPLHPSETALDDAEFDYEIINDGTIADLVEKVREILVNEKLL